MFTDYVFSKLADLTCEGALEYLVQVSFQELYNSQFVLFWYARDLLQHHIHGLPTPLWAIGCGQRNLSLLPHALPQGVLRDHRVGLSMLCNAARDAMMATMPFFSVPVGSWT
jgi:hypothetical protein